MINQAAGMSEKIPQTQISCPHCSKLMLYQLHSSEPVWGDLFDLLWCRACGRHFQLTEVKQ